LTLSLRKRFTLSLYASDNSEIIKYLIHLFIENTCPENIMETRVINKRRKKEKMKKKETKSAQVPTNK